MRVQGDTVGVCSGFHDINGCLIFEGDRIRSEFGIEYLVKVIKGSIRAVNWLGFAYDIEDISKPEIF